MKLIVGLGNPGPRYAGTRHNVGFEAVGRFAERRAIALDEERFGGRFGRGRAGRQSLALLLPGTFMNRSGDAVGAALEALPAVVPADDLLLVLDDIDLPLARLRMRRFGGAGGHRGLEHVMSRLGHGDFPRLRVGVGRPPDDVDPVDWVLSPFAPEERDALPAALEAAADAIDGFVRDGVEMAMNRANRLRSAPDAQEDEPPA